ncbi:MAG TPA: hypothetical protein VGE26_09660 [Sphingobacteriaceae bacterium]
MVEKYGEKEVTVEIIDRSSFEYFQEIRTIFLKANSRLNSFLSDGVLSYQFDEMNVTILPIANILIARSGDRIAGFIAMLDNYIIGIYTDNASDSPLVDRKLLDAARQLYPTLEVNVFLKNLKMVEFYVNEGFNLSAYKTSLSASETMLTLLFDPVESEFDMILAPTGENSFCA